MGRVLFYAQIEVTEAQADLRARIRRSENTLARLAASASLDDEDREALKVARNQLEELRASIDG